MIAVVLPSGNGWGQTNASRGVPNVASNTDYVVTAIRRASDVKAGAVDASVRSIRIGMIVSFGKSLKWLWGPRCRDWSLADSYTPVVNLQDSNLSDTQVLASDRKHSDHRINSHHVLRCGGANAGTFARIDRRTLVTPTPSGASYIILERQLGLIETSTLQQRLLSMKYLSGPADGVMDPRTRRSVALYALHLGAAYTFQNGIVTENLLASLEIEKIASPDKADEKAKQSEPLELLKVVHYGPLSAIFMGVEEPLAPLTYGVRELWFAFKGEAKRIRFNPTGTLYFSDWYFDAVFSPDLSYVLLPQDHYGPYHAVRTENLREYLQGNRKPDYVVGENPSPGIVATVHSDPEWVSENEVQVRLTCCGRTETKILRLSKEGIEQQ